MTDVEKQLRQARQCSLCPRRMYVKLIGESWLVFYCEHCDRMPPPV